MIPNPAIRFIRFEYDGYYPQGGLQDSRGSFATLDEAIKAPVRYDNGEVLDTWTGQSWASCWNWQEKKDEWVTENNG